MSAFFSEIIGSERARRRFFSWTIVLVWAFILAFPAYWLVLTTFKTGLAFTKEATYLPWVDFDPTLSAWETVFVGRSDRMMRPLLNSTVIATVSSAAALILATSAGYALARFRYNAGPITGNNISFWFLQQRMIPAAILAIPLLVGFRELRLLDNQLALIITYTVFGVPFAVWMLREFFRSLPVEVEEAAMIDGASRLGVIRHIVFPLSAPGIVAVFLLLFIGSWNEYYFALVLTFTRSVTVPLWLQGEIAQVLGIQWGNLAVIAVVMTLPPVLAGLVLERFIRRGLTFGAIKG
ncbi:MAG: carbohydrate ABC transporter permease [Dehalococcoidia bacterium]|jgi:multiple sugar transport system permease protein|nr:carbohydrate ABC transporter permease [Dehalococcoidia bacterium]